MSQYTLAERGYFDIVLAFGILHHLDDAEAVQLFRIAHDALKTWRQISDSRWCVDKQSVRDCQVSIGSGPRAIRADWGALRGTGLASLFYG